MIASLTEARHIFRQNVRGDLIGTRELDLAVAYIDGYWGYPLSWRDDADVVEAWARGHAEAFGGIGEN